MCFHINVAKRGKKCCIIKSFYLLNMQKHKKPYNNNKLKISTSIWNEKFEYFDGLYFVLDIRGYFEYIILTNQKIYINKIENRIAFTIMTGYYLELLNYETMRLVGSTENKITNEKNSVNSSHLEITKAVLIHCNVVNNDCQQYSRVLLIQSFHILKYGL